MGLKQNDVFEENLSEYHTSLLQDRDDYLKSLGDDIMNLVNLAQMIKVQYELVLSVCKMLDNRNYPTAEELAQKDAE